MPLRDLRSISPLPWALGASVALHAAVLLTRFFDPAGLGRVLEDTPLEVILVNARANERPEPRQAKAIAQATLSGGGQAERGRASTPLPPVVPSEPDDAAQDAQSRIDGLLQQQTLLLAQIRKQLAAIPPPEPGASGSTPAALQREARRRQLAGLLAEIERRINEENARPRRRYVSPSTREEVYALYYDQLRQRIENRGTENFPEVAGRKLYGELTMVITINHDGRLLGAEVAQSSGTPALDHRAQAIARSAGPFGTFSQAMRRKADQLVVVSRFRFTREKTLETQLDGR